MQQPSVGGGVICTPESLDLKSDCASPQKLAADVSAGTQGSLPAGHHLKCVLGGTCSNKFACRL